MCQACSLMRKLNILSTITTESLKANSLIEERSAAQGSDSCIFYHRHKSKLHTVVQFQKCCSLPARAWGAHLSEEDGQHVLPLEADGQVHQGVAHVEGRRAVQQPHLVRRQLPGDVPSR